MPHWPSKSIRGRCCCCSYRKGRSRRQYAYTYSLAPEEATSEKYYELNYYGDKLHGMACEGGKTLGAGRVVETLTLSLWRSVESSQGFAPNEYSSSTWLLLFPPCA